ncbi:MAG TPA: NAD(P)/FAD-dependent oxidoreductase [Gammaproteobacteria bacterium]|nr:NAD(P)/FAD-dependent oxidoreductase [Gammaproteobacteria bacterium]
MADSECDVLVIGGGPGGSTVATLLARRGWRVTVLEKAHHPRFHIGESLLPLNMPILKELGVFDAVAAIGIPKHGADFAGPADTNFKTYYFRTALNCRFPHAFQVKREEFDDLLFRHATANGVDTHEGIAVEEVSWDAEGRATVDARTETGESRRWHARYVVDASGRDTFLGNRFKLKRPNPRHRSAAIYRHFRGISGRSGEDAGNIGIYWMPHGWAWMIPLRGGITSIGCVCWPDYLKQRQGVSQDQFLLDTLRQAPAIWNRMSGMEPAGPVYMAGNYSYACTRIGGKGWIMVGDAYSFLDPVFSSGVYLAMSSARRAAIAVDAILRKPSREAALQRRYARETRRGLRKFSWFIYRFTTPAIKKLFMAPRNVLQIEQAVTSMLAGDVYRNRAADRRLFLFKLLYRITGLSTG